MFVCVCAYVRTCVHACMCMQWSKENNQFILIIYFCNSSEFQVPIPGSDVTLAPSPETSTMHEDE